MYLHRHPSYRWYLSRQRLTKSSWWFKINMNTVKNPPQCRVFDWRDKKRLGNKVIIHLSKIKSKIEFPIIIPWYSYSSIIIWHTSQWFSLFWFDNRLYIHYTQYNYYSSEKLVRFVGQNKIIIDCELISDGLKHTNIEKSTIYYIHTREQKKEKCVSHYGLTTGKTVVYTDKPQWEYSSFGFRIKVRCIFSLVSRTKKKDMIILC